MQNYILNEKMYSEYLKDKKVIICGPGASLTGRKLGKKIDNSDIVVRLNNSYPVNASKPEYKIDVGSRTDVLYHTGAISTCLRIAANRYKLGRMEMLKKDGLRWFLSKRDPINGSERDKAFLERFIKTHDKYIHSSKKNEGVNIVTVSNIFLGELQTILDRTDPNMSTLAIIHLLTYDLKQLEIVGCDFYSSGYHPYYCIPGHIKWDQKKKKLVRKDGKARRKGKIQHNYNNQIKFLLEVIANDSRVIVEKKIIDGWRSQIGG